MLPQSEPFEPCVDVALMKAQEQQVLTGIRCRHCVLASHVARKSLLNDVSDELYSSPPEYPISSLS